MDRLWIILFALSGAVSCSHGWISVPTLEVTTRPGDNITLYCDCSGSYELVWFRNCSHENQPTLVLSQFTAYRSIVKHTGFEFLKNFSSNSYDLLIVNVTDSHEGLYYCGTEELKLEDEKCITSSYDYRYGNVTTRLIVNPDTGGPHRNTNETLEDSGLCWRLLFFLGPAVAVLSSMFIFQLCRETAKCLQVDEKRTDTRRQIPPIQDEDVLHAALELHQATQRPKRMKTWSSDITVCTYSVIRTSDPTM